MAESKTTLRRFPSPAPIAGTSLEEDGIAGVDAEDKAGETRVKGDTEGTSLSSRTSRLPLPPPPFDRICGKDIQSRKQIRCVQEKKVR